MRDVGVPCRGPMERWASLLSLPSPSLFEWEELHKAGHWTDGAQHGMCTSHVRCKSKGWGTWLLLRQTRCTANLISILIESLSWSTTNRNIILFVRLDGMHRQFSILIPKKSNGKEMGHATLATQALATTHSWPLVSSKHWFHTWWGEGSRYSFYTTCFPSSYLPALA